MRAIIFDASTLITLSMNGLFNELRELKKVFRGKFIISKEVYGEIVERPIKTKRFELEALRLKQLVDEKVLELPSALGIKDDEITSKAQVLLDHANSSFRGRGKDIHLIDMGEASVLALHNILNEKKIENVVAVDERTTRVMCEKPDNLIKLLKRKLHTDVKMDKKKASEFTKCKLIRSSELVYIMWRKGIVKLKDPRTLEALLWAVRFKGCSISDQEIKDIQKLK